MKNMKKLVATVSAFAIAMSIGVSAFAEYDTATYDAETNIVSLSDDPAVVGAIGTSITMADGEEYTVIIISEADQNNVTADNLYYLNQGTSAESFWATNGMGIRLAEDTVELAEGNYIVRIGDKAGNIVEIEFTISTTPAGPTYTPGDCDGQTGVSSNDATAILKSLVGKFNFTGDQNSAADCDGQVGISSNDATAILKSLVGKATLQYAK